MDLGFVKWMRKVLPRGEMVAFAVITFTTVECVQLFCLLCFGNVNAEFFRSIRLTLLLLNAVGYGIYRVVGFHPAADPDYRRWLEMTPWSIEKPLPGGPLQLVPQDLVVIGALTLIYRPVSLTMLAIPTAFLVGYQLTLAGYSRLIGHWGIAYMIGLMLGVVFYFADRPEAAFAAADGCFIIGRLAVHRALQSFPWQLPWQADMNSFKAFDEEEKRRRLGWPYDQLSPKSPRRVILYHDGWCLGLLAGCWWFAGMKYFTPDVRPFMPFIIVLFVFGAGIIRIGQYAVSHRSPIDFFGGLLTGRWLIPSYDQINLSPLFALTVAGVTEGAAIYLQLPRGFKMATNPIPGMIVSSVGLTLSLWCLLVFGPEYERWRLAAQHRIVFDIGNNDTRGKADQFVQL